jgi:cullin 1
VATIASPPLPTPRSPTAPQRSPYNWAKELYKGHADTIVQYVKESVLPALQSRTGENLLKEMNRRWENHKILNLWMMNFFLYLDRYYIQYQNLPALKNSGLTKFKDLVFDAIKVSTT